MPNGSFEEYYWCPSFAEGFYINACKEWTTPNLGSPDYFHQCNTDYDDLTQRFQFSVPENYRGYQYARTGVAYAGLILTQDVINGIPGLTYAEYIQVRLIEKLKANKFYKITFYSSLDDSGFRCVNSIGALFTKFPLDVQNDQRIIEQPQFQSHIDFFYCDTNIWYENTGYFLANGDEEYLTIGVFREFPELKSKGADGQDTISNGVYWYIDDVSLVETDMQLSNVFTPNNDLTNDIYSFNVNDLGFLSGVICNRWGNVIIESNSILLWDGTHNGNECPDGLYYLVLVAENKITTGFIHLIR